MTFPVWVEIVCAQCDKTAVGCYCHTRRVPIRTMKKSAKRQGFVFKYGEAFCCEDCARKYFDVFIKEKLLKDMKITCP